MAIKLSMKMKTENKTESKGDWEPSHSVWLAKLPDECTEDDLLGAGNQTGGTAVSAHVGKGGKGRITFSSEDEAKTAIEALNGAQLGDNKIEADKWTRSEKKSGGRSWGGKGGNRMVRMPHFDKRDPASMMAAMMSMMMGGGGKGGKGKGGKGKGGRKHDPEWKKHFAPEKAVWLGKLPEEATDKDLKDLGDQAGSCVYAKTMRGGTGVLLFDSAETATAALALLNGAQVGDNTIEADEWTSNRK